MPANYNELHQVLLEQRQHLLSQLDTIAHTVREDGVGYSNHMADVGTEVFEQARDVSLARQLKRSLESIEHALSKFDDGTYGICEMCGAIIELARLEALPSAQYCMQCQSRREGTR
ncbi:MAG TPA: TraR/DksA C4-type zinc finger protein [Anaerolineae bacterium]|nr:TraR/DksA C4-type zinc finger protein [Anaerolineae bacterium]HQK12872.1 TraR/DksA C4-type zinc finger protein [Anaerolineae bacterium]